MPSLPPSPPLSEAESRSTGSAALPLPVRGTRYVVGAILLSVIVTVVVTTYLRIEQQLQATIESKLVAALQDHVHAATDWIKRRRELTRHVARLGGVVEAARTALERPDEPGVSRRILRSEIATLQNTDLVKDAYLLSIDGTRVLCALTSRTDVGAPYAELGAEVVRLYNAGKRDVALAGRNGRSSLMTFAPVVADRPIAILALSVEPDALIQGLDAQRPDSEDSYAFDANGRVPSDPSVAARGRVPPSALEVARAPTTPHGERRRHVVDEYASSEGRAVVSAWTWLDEFGFGIATEVPTAIARDSIALLRQSFLILVTLVGAAVLGFIALGRWTLRVREESLLMTRRLTRLARAIQPLSAALEHDPSAVLLVDYDGTVVYANASSHRVLGVSAPLLGRDVDAVFEGLHAELQSALASGQDSIVAKGNDSLDETLLVSSRSLSIDGAPHFLYMLRPITQQVRRQEVEHWKKLIRVLSHELNNALAPIASLLSSARKLNQMTHQDERLKQIFESISERTTHLISFLEGYREVARLPRPAPCEVDWHSFIESLSSQKRFRHEGPLPEHPGFFDPIQIERVVTNVLNNAHEAGSPEHEVQVEISEESEGFRINIMDRGSGMPEAVLKQAMLPFFSTKRTGTGVGLALSREIIEAHGGELTLANRDGGGLVVSCYLPTPQAPKSRTSLGRVAAITGDVVFRPSSVPPSEDDSRPATEFSTELLRNHPDAAGKGTEGTTQPVHESPRESPQQQDGLPGSDQAREHQAREDQA